MLREGDFNCPMSNAMRARRLYLAKKRPDEFLEDFTNSFIMDALDLRDKQGPGSVQIQPAGRGVAHEGVDAWTQHALAQYDEAFPVANDEVLLFPAKRPWYLEKTLSRPDH